MDTQSVNESETIPEEFLESFNQQKIEKLKIQVMTAMNAYLPIMTCVIDFPGADATEDRKSQAISRIILVVQKSVSMLLERFSIKPSAYANALLSQPVMHLVKVLWREQVGDVEPEQVVSYFLSIVEQIEPLPETIFEELPRVIETDIGVANEMCQLFPIFNRIEDLSDRPKEMLIGRQSDEAFKMLVSRTLVRHLNQVVKGFATQASLSEVEIKTVRRYCLQTIGKIYASTLIAEFDKHWRTIQNMPREERVAFHASIADIPNGYLYETAIPKIEKHLKMLYPSLSLFES